MANMQGSAHESFVRISQQFISISSQPDSPRLLSVLGLAMTRLQRHLLSNQMEDLDRAILYFTESILFPPRSWLEHDPMILAALFLLTQALVKRSIASKLPEDAIYAAKYLRRLRDQPFGFPRHALTTLLMDVLAFQVELGAGDVVQNIDEMAVLCHELLTSEPDASEDDTTHSVTCISELILSKVRLWLPHRPLHQVIKCLRAARIHKPDLRQAHFALAVSLGIHYYVTFMDDDYEKATSVLDEIITSKPTGDDQGDFVAEARWFVTILANTRSITHEIPEYLEEAIYRTHAFHTSSPVNFSPDITFDLKDTANQRTRHFGSVDGPVASSSNSPLSQPVPVTELSISEYKGDDPRFGRIHENMKLLGGLLSKIRNTNNIIKIDEAIKKGRSILASTPMDIDASCLFELFGFILSELFTRTNKIDYLNESISTRRHVFEEPLPQFLHFTTNSRLSISLLTRFLSFPDYRAQDLDEGTELLSQCVKDRHASLSERFQLACEWASVARRTRHHTIPTAYESAMSLMQDFLLFAPTLQLQHATLATLDDSHRVPRDYTSYRVDIRQLEEAIVTLERGRAILWSEMRRLRASVDQLLQEYPQLGQRFAAVNRDLEELTKSVPPSHTLSIDDDSTDDLRAVDPFGRLVLKQRKLLKERDKLISQIQTLGPLPDFNGFLPPLSFDALRSAASSGPVIIINHSKWRSDVLVLLHNTSPSLITTPYDFYDRASVLKDKLLGSRNRFGLDSSNYDRDLAFVLAELYNLVGKPVINRLRQLNIPEQSRIWWCPTSVFCSLPLHAMGPIPSDDGEIRYFLDLYICSYTPTLSALIQSRDRKSALRTLDRPAILLVALPDPSLPTVGGEIQVVQRLDTEVTNLISEVATPAAVLDGFQHHPFVHFACHGTLEACKPFDAGFELYREERLTLLEIIRSHLPTAEFAFLSACHTAEVTEGGITDEVLHLAAAVQFCGFRSVVGTMWAMVDEDGRDLAEHFYKVLFANSRREQGVPYYERSAKALRMAVKKLRRKKRISLERWVNFVHYGA